ncbi:MAG: phage virion morphogenesis protein [Treponema sp.]|jgi:phage virion morphogenesis protein|nr:phage virion morphogenesis protein [Treponema sp.]
MAGSTVELGLKEVEGLTRILNGVKLESQDRVRLLKDIGVEMESQTQERFDTKKDPEGKPWAALAQKTLDYYRERFPHAQPPLVIDGGLRDSIESQTPDSWSVLVGATKIYAAIHQWGGEIVPKTAAALYVPGYGKLKKVNIPARPYLGVSSQDAADIATLAQGFIAGRFK